MSTKKSLFFVLLALVGLAAMARESAAERTMQQFRQMGLPILEAEQADILPTAVQKFDILFDDIEHAERYILLDYFKFQQDSICGRMLERLYRKVREGVDVYILFDSFGNKNSDQPLSDTLMQSIRRRGIHIEDFDPVRFPWVNHLMHRNHHKIAVIDGKVVYTGGMNVADYYLHGKPKVGKWRDMHVRMTGSIVQAYEQLFWKMWGKETGEKKTPSNSPFRGRTSGEESLPIEGEVWRGSGQWSSVPVAFASRWPRETPDIMRRTYCVAIDNAENLIQIVNPYAGLFGEVRAALRRALERGVRVQFMVSLKSDGKANDDVIGREMHKLMKRGAEVYYYTGGFHHSKVMMIDSTFCTVGTTNLDARSLCFDYEVNAFIFSPTVTHALQRIYQDDIEQHSILLTPEVWDREFPPRRRIRSRFFTIAKRFM